MTGQELADLVSSAGLGATVGPSADPRVLTVTVPAGQWLPLLTLARDRLGCDFFDWLSAVDEAAEGVAVLAHVFSLAGRHHLLLRTVLTDDEPRLPTATGVYRGAAWHERETREMFGVLFDGHPGPGPLLLADGFEGHPLRKEFPLAARAAQEWPGAREPGEPADPGRPVRGRRRAVPPGVPEGWVTEGRPAGFPGGLERRAAGAEGQPGGLEGQPGGLEGQPGGLEGQPGGLEAQPGGLEGRPDR